MSQQVLLGCAHSGDPFGPRASQYCSIACRSAGQRAARRDPDPIIEDWPRGLSNSRLDPPCGREDSPLRIPVIQRHTDVNFQDCYVVWCSCGFESVPYVHLEVAQMMAWRHSFAWRISDLRVDPTEIAPNGNGVSRNGHRG